MIEVVAVTITAGASVLVATIMARATWSASTVSSAANLAEVERIREASRQKERDKRRETYRQFMSTLNNFYNLLGVEADREQVDAISHGYLFLLEEVLLDGPPTVCAAAYNVNTVYDETWSVVKRLESESPEEAYPELWRQATGSFKTELKKAGAGLLPAMRDDLGRGFDASDWSRPVPRLRH